MKPTLAVVMAGLLSTLLFSCESTPKEDLTNAVNRNGSVETDLKVEHLDSLSDVMITTHRIWVHDSLIKTSVHYDTLPALGRTREIAENQEGDTMPVTVKKDYEIFITVK
jgi:hypothetical protein